MLRTLPPLVSPEHATLEPNIPGAIRILELLAAGRHFYQMPFFKVIGPEAIGPCPVWLCSLRSLAAILNCPWWTRIWIVQEAMLSTRATVHIGEYQAPLSLFLNFRRSIVEHESDCCGIEELQNLWYGRLDTSTSLLHAGNRLDELRARDDDRLDGRIILLDALYISSSRQASDPRDHVYALHGVLDYGYGLIKPSYELSTEKVFSNATRELFQDTRSLSALGHAIGVEPNNVHELPSWVCDWTRRINPITFSQLYKASNGEVFIAKQTIERILTVEACKVDMISTTKSPIPCSRLATVTGLIETLEEWRSLVNIKGSDDLFAFWTTVCFGTIKLSGEEIRRILPKDWIIIKTWWEEVQSVKKEGRNYFTAIRRDRDLLNVGVSIRRSAQRYNFWLTSQGFLGVGPRTLEKGDEVFIAKGSSVPLIFRPIENTLAQSFGVPANERGYLFVGPCYLHGFMDGEAVKPDTKWQTVHLC